MKIHLSVFLLAALLPAQDQNQDQNRPDPPSRVARLAYLDGNVSFQPQGTTEWAAAERNRPLSTGDRLFTETGARAELNTGTAAYRIAPRTGINIDELSDSLTRIVVTEGALSFRVSRLDDGESIEIDTPNGTIQVARPGQYRVNVLNPGRTEVNVLVGQLTVNGTPISDRGGAIVNGQQGTVQAGPMMPRDNVDQWAESRDRLADRSASAQYLPPGTIGYEDLDQNGSWASVPEYGMIWRPRTVPAGWAPYRNGHWAYVGPWGWTWVDDAPWGFAPFHYGRWAYVQGGWGWVPGPRAVRAVYAPALVSFQVGGLSIGIGSARPVSWVPLGPGEVWAPGYHASPAYWNRVNVHNTVIVNKTTINNYYENRHVTVERTYVNQVAPNAVSSVSRESFTAARPVHQSLIDNRAAAAARPAAARPVEQRRPDQRQAQRQEDRPAQRPARTEDPRAMQPEPTRQSRLGANAERAVPRPPEHISRANVRPERAQQQQQRREERKP